MEHPQPPPTTTQTSGCHWSPRRTKSPLALLPPGVEREHITKFAGAEELRLIRLLSKRHLQRIAIDGHWRVLCDKLWTDKPGFAGRRKPLWGVFAASGELTVADRALQSSSETQASFVRVSLSEPRTHDLAPHETCRRLNWRESYDGSVKDATRDEITAQELERWPWLCMDYMGFRGHALAFEGRGLRHGGDALFQERHRFARHAWTRAAPASLVLNGLQLSPGGSGTLRVERRENWGWRLRHMYWAWDAAPGVTGPGSWRRDARLGVE
ncbi:unnamed protein product [Pelagomonas calceolata]|uniref:Uncharacterized protein n=1 Tax=Pelagomonas calceolata TaxID=35677 RepID=A0A8J2SLP6_9STRA|nr:unnamed protein product [Pelagomonas calceolata]